MLLDRRSHPADDTPALVIDFDHAEIKNETVNDDESKDEDKNRKKRQTVVCPDICLCWAWLTTQQGTPIFMARSVVAGHPLTLQPGVCVLRGIPSLSALALPVYSKLLPERLEKIPQPLKDQAMYFVMIPEWISINQESLRSLPWTHELWHDGESMFWLLVWWAIHLRSPNKPNSPSPSEIPDGLFRILTDVDPATGEDGRNHFISEIVRGRSWLDPEYRGLEVLFQQMATQLQGDLYWAKHGGPKEMKDPEFLHEALQRIIFNFLMENKTKHFMNLEKDPCHHREVAPQIPPHAEKQITHPKRTRSTMADTSESEEDEVSHLSSPVLVHSTYSCSNRNRSAIGCI